MVPLKEPLKEPLILVAIPNQVPGFFDAGLWGQRGYGAESARAWAPTSNSMGLLLVLLLVLYF